MKKSFGILIAAVALIALGTSLWIVKGGSPPEVEETASGEGDDTSNWEQQVGGTPGPATPDRFHPDGNRDMPAPRRGGRVIVHISSFPKHMNYATENSATTRRVLREVHDTLLDRDWETWEMKAVVAESWVEEDTLVLPGGRGDANENIHYGKITEEGDEYVIEPVSKGNRLSEVKRVKKAEGMVLQRGNVFTFKLREDVKWHDGKPFDAHDVAFSHGIYKNPHVDCEAARYKFQGGFCDVIDDHNVRIFYDKQYFLARASFDDLTLLASHVYNLRDPDHPQRDANVSDEDLGKYINEHPANRNFIGLGAYKITEYKDEYIEAVRNPDYFAKDDAGWVDGIRWRHISSDDTAKQAVINGDIDYWERLRTEDYFGEFTQQKAFTDSYYKGLASMNYMGYTAWNCRRSKLSDPNVRLALGMAFDWDDYIKNVYFGLGARMTSTAYFFAPTNNRDIEPIPFDLEGAEDLLLEAGWYDRDGDDIIDKDGNPFVLEFLMPTGNKASELFGQKLQENLGKIGIKLEIATREWATFLERLYERDFDCANLAWITPVQSDPEQIWMAYQADVPRSSSHSGFKSEKADALIKKIQVELDDEKRIDLFHQLWAEIYSKQPYMFGINQPKKYAMSKRIRNLKTYGIDPGYRVRDWYIVE